MFLGRPGVGLEGSWRRLGSLGGVLEASGGFLGRSWALLGVCLELFWTYWRCLGKQMSARICQDVDRNPRDVKTLKNQWKNNVFFGCRGSSGGLLATFWAFLLALWKSLEEVLGVLCGVLEALEAPRRAKTGQDGCKACKDGFKYWQGERSERASEASEASGAIRMKPDV